MDMDGDEGCGYNYYDDDEDEVYMPETKIGLVGEDNFECEFSAHFTKSDFIQPSFEIPVHADTLHIHIRALPRSSTRK